MTGLIWAPTDDEGKRLVIYATQLYATQLADRLNARENPDPNFVTPDPAPSTDPDFVPPPPARQRDD